jgi:endogenous inhibitor of DNA gyrase (YacG/DUF329 family)
MTESKNAKEEIPLLCGDLLVCFLNTDDLHMAIELLFKYTKATFNFDVRLNEDNIGLINHVKHYKKYLETLVQDIAKDDLSWCKGTEFTEFLSLYDTCCLPWIDIDKNGELFEISPLHDTSGTAQLLAYLIVKYCSVKRVRLLLKKCPACNEYFLSERAKSTNKYCSNKCRNNINNMRRVATGEARADIKMRREKFPEDYL